MIVSIFMVSCQNQKVQTKDQDSKIIVDRQVIEEVAKQLITANAEMDADLIERGVEQAAHLWRENDGSIDDFKNFCKINFAKSNEAKDKLFRKLQRSYEVLWGNSIKLLLELREPMDKMGGEVSVVDQIFFGYDTQAHLEEDLYGNKIAFITVLNFPSFTLAEKQELGENWNRTQWAYARMGDIFTARVPSSIKQYDAKVSSAADAYIAEYNIYMGNVLGDDNKTHFDTNKVLITHWNLRDELKSNYLQENGQYKQEMIYSVMQRIINQSIPQEVINSGEYQWDVANNKILKDGKEVEFTSEPNTRYQHLLNNFKSKLAFDPYFPDYPSYIERRFSGNMEIAKEDIQRIFKQLVSSPQTKKVAEIIKNKLGRDLRPYDIWYNGFRAKSSFSEEELDDILQKKYPNAQALEDDLARMLVDLQFTEEQAKFLSSKISVDAARGAGHAWGAEMKSENARLRTRIAANGMNYKGYNIAVHEFGHNVEQTITLQNVDNYMMKGVPNTAFTEALAFIFQSRDLKLMGLEENNPDKVHMMALANFWSSYEIMGVSLLDISVWEWMYANPKADAAQLKEAVIRLAKEIWNEYYAPVFGVKDSPILAIYSHMIASPLYLSAYPIGHLIDFQIEQQIKGKNFAEEVYRMFTMGRLAPQLWLKKGVGSELSAQPLLDATEKAVEAMK